MKFRSKVDIWFYVLALGVPIAVIAYSIGRMESAEPTSLLVFGVVCVAVVVFPIWLMFSTSYTVESDVLKIRSGPLGWSIPLGDIKSVEPSRSILSSPALSLRRLKISYGKNKSILVSPEDMEGFKNALGV